MKLSRPAQVASVMGLIFLAQGKSWSAGEVLPGSVLPEQVGKALTAEQPAPERTLPAPITPPKPEPTPGGEAAKKIKFQLNGIILDGNCVYTDAQLRALFKNKLHKTISVAELFEIVQGITNYYRNNGYIISRAILPPQHVKGGVVRIQIIEGFIAKVDVGGDPKRAKCLVLAFGRKIKECPPLKISHMEKYLLLANEIPSTQVKAVLSPSKTTTGAADLTLMAQNQFVTGYVSYDNYGTRYIGPQQMTANAGVNSWLASGDSLQGTFTKTPKGGELTYMDGNYNAALDAEGDRLFFGGTRTHTHPLFVLQPAQIDGINVNYYATLQMPVIRKRDESLTMQFAFNYLDSTVTTIRDIQLYTDHLRPLGFGGTYNFSDRWYGANSIYADVRQGLPMFGYTSNTNPLTAETSRPGGRGDFTKIDLQVSRLQAIKGPLSLYGVFRGQWAFNPLLASEQFTFGGSQIGRGYDVAEIIGDKGAAGSLELRYDYFIGRILQSLQLYIFYDVGEIWNFKNIGGAPRKVSGTSTGVGTRFFFTKYVSGNLMWTQTLTKEVAAEQLIGDGRRPRVFFSIVASL